MVFWFLFLYLTVMVIFYLFFFSSRRRHTRSVSAFLLNRSSDLIMSQVTEQSVRFQTALASIKLIQASAVLDLTEDDFDFLTSNKVWIATDRSRARRCVEACVYGTLDFVGYPRFPAPVEKECRSEERFSRNAETDIVCCLLLEKKKRGNEKVRPESSRSVHFCSFRIYHHL